MNKFQECQQYNNLLMKRQSSKRFPSPQNKINISHDQIELPQKKDRQTQRNDYHKIIEQNRFIKKQNEILKKELEQISLRLDSEIKKRLDENKKKPPLKLQENSLMELQNAYKKCQIYKREVNSYKKRLEIMEDSGNRQEELESRVVNYEKQIKVLNDELKYMKKISKLQEKGLAEVGAEGYLKMVSQNEKQKDELRKLKKQLDEYRRGRNDRVKTSSNVRNENDIESKTQDINQSTSYKRVKTESDPNNEELLDLLQQKIEKDYAKMKNLMNEKNKMREIIDNLKLQLNEKDQEISGLKDKIENLRKNNQQLKSQNSILNKKNLDDNSSQNIRDRNNNGSKSKLEREPSNLKSSKKPNNSAVDDYKRQQSQKNEEKKIKEVKQRKGKYPRMEEQGQKEENTIKWNHHQFSSKIKEIQILIHEDGHIKDIHVRYQKGEPKKYDSSKGKYSIFVCSEANQFIKYIQGGFMDGYLQYLIVTSSSKRTCKYGRFELQNNQECDNFSFNVQDDEYPAAMFGENDSEGIKRLGCLIQKDIII